MKSRARDQTLPYFDLLIFTRMIMITPKMVSTAAGPPIAIASPEHRICCYDGTSTNYDHSEIEIFFEVEFWTLWQLSWLVGATRPRPRDRSMRCKCIMELKGSGECGMASISRYSARSYRSWTTTTVKQFKSNEALSRCWAALFRPIRSQQQSTFKMLVDSSSLMSSDLIGTVHAAPISSFKAPLVD